MSEFGCITETEFPSPKETMYAKEYLWEARDFSRVRLHKIFMRMDAELEFYKTSSKSI